MPQRTAPTLVEVLISIFIMALGLMALLTLFPLGAVQMARAIQDDRAATLANNSAAYFRWYWKKLIEADSYMRTEETQPSSPQPLRNLYGLLRTPFTGRA